MRFPGQTFRPIIGKKVPSFWGHGKRKSLLAKEPRALLLVGFRRLMNVLANQSQDEGNPCRSDSLFVCRAV